MSLRFRVLQMSKPLIEGSNLSFALRCIPAGDVVFDASHNYTPPPPYQASVSHNCFRFLDSAMHFRPAELNVLLRSLPAQPMQRRLFFSMVVACRRRLAKRWEQTPLAKLFTLEDEWSMLAQRAQAVRVREAIRARGLLLHDAFLKFDYDRNGLLSPGEVYGALEWLEVPDVTPADVLFFVRSISREDHISYANFMELLCAPDEAEALANGGNGGSTAGEESGGVGTPAALMPPAQEAPASSDAAVAAAGGGASTALVISPPMLAKQRSRVAPKGEEQLLALLKEHRTEEQRLQAELERLQKAQREEAKARLDALLVDSDFSWMVQSKRGNATNPRTTRTSRFWDFTRCAQPGSRDFPLWMEARGRWAMVRQGAARVQTAASYLEGYVGRARLAEFVRLHPQVHPRPSPNLAPEPSPSPTSDPSPSACTRSRCSGCRTRIRRPRST